MAAGRLELTDCAIAGPADGGAGMVRNGIVAQAGSVVSVARGRFGAAAEIMIYADGADLRVEGLEISQAAQNAMLLRGQGHAQVEGVRITGQSQTMLALTQGAALTAREIVLEGTGGTALFAQGAGALDLGGFDLRGPFDGGIVLQGGEGVRIDGFAVSGAAHPVQVQGLVGPVHLRDGRIVGVPGNASMVVSDSPGVVLDRLRITGGDVGLFLSGRIDGMRLSGAVLSGQTSYGIAFQDIPQGEGADMPVIEDTTVIATGGALGLFAKDAGLIGLRDNTFLGQTDPTIHLENAFVAEAAGNRLITVPGKAERRLVLRDMEGDLGRRLVPGGRTEPVRGVIVPAEGAIALSLADIVATDGLTREEKFALADFTSAQKAPDTALLEMALLAIPPVQSLAERAGVSVELAPPGGYDGWLPDAMTIGLVDGVGRRQELRPGDFPRVLLPGSYRVLIDGRDAGVARIEAGKPLVLPDLDQPHLVSRDAGGRILRGPYLHLRAPNVLARILEGWRPLRLGEWMGGASYSVARRGADRALAASMVAEARTRLKPLQDEIAAATAAENGLLVDRLWNMQRMYLEILGEFGGAQDLDWLISELVAADVAPSVLVAIRAEARLGRLVDSPLKALAVARLSQGLDDGTARRIVEAMARLGDPWALGVLAALRAAAVRAAEPTDAVPDGIETLVLAEPDIALGHMRDYLTRLAANGRAYAEGGTIERNRLGWAADWRNAGLAMAYIARHGSAADRALLSLPVPLAADFVGLLPFVSDGPGLVRNYLRDLPDGEPRRINGWKRNHGLWLCPALTLSPPERVGTLVADMEAAVAEAVRRLIVTDYWQRDADGRRRIDNGIAFTEALSASHCLLDESVLAVSGTAAEEEDRKFGKNPEVGLLDWWVRPVRAERLMRAMAQGDSYLPLGVLSPYDTDLLMAALAEAGGTEAEFTRLFEAHHRLLTNAFVSPQWFVSFQSERRVFRLRSEGGDGTISIAGHVDIRPIPEGDRLLIAIRHDIRSRDYEGGFAAMITAPDREPYERDNRRAMFESVALEQAGKLSEAQFLTATPEGVLLFEVPYSGDLAESYLRIGMRFVDTRWDLDVSLYDSHLAVDSRRLARRRAEVTQ